MRPIVPIAILGAAVLALLAAPASASPALSPPVIHEHFTPLPCAGRPGHRPTLQQEGCAEHQILATDSTINALARSVFLALNDRAARERFISAQHSWLAFRRSDCHSMSDIFQGGTEAAVVDALCTVAHNHQRITDLRQFRRNLNQGG